MSKFEAVTLGNILDDDTIHFLNHLLEKSNPEERVVEYLKDRLMPISQAIYKADPKTVKKSEYCVTYCLDADGSSYATIDGQVHYLEPNHAIFHKSNVPIAVKSGKAKLFNVCYKF